jgi:hypothetical protein
MAFRVFRHPFAPDSCRKIAAQRLSRVEFCPAIRMRSRAVSFRLKASYCNDPALPFDSLAVKVLTHRPV